jgi:hypothetical protein
MQQLVQNQHNQPVVGAQPRYKHGEFLKGRPPVFTHAADPLEADDWLRAVEKQLNIAQCDDRQKVLFAYGRPANAPVVTWQEFRENFRGYHIPEEMIELKAEEFRNLTKGSLSVAEYHDRFAQLS